MNWNQLLCEERQRPPRNPNGSDRDTRSEFQRDYHRIICSASFRRLQDKTQVFPLDNSDFVRTRLTHSLEVSSFAKSLGQMSFQYLIENRSDAGITVDIKEKCCSILECAGLLHDIGNPPFGHFGEQSIRNWFKQNLQDLEYKGKKASDCLNEQMKNDLYNFEGNAQAIRLLSKLHFLVDENGMNLTYALLNTLIKYPVSSCGMDKTSPDIRLHKMGYYFAEQDLFEKITRATGAGESRYPLTFLLEAADDIAYMTADIEDAVKKGIISYETLLNEIKSNEDECANDEERDLYKEVFVSSLEKKYNQAKRKGVFNPELNAVQNWVIKVQGFLLQCATYGFTRNYSKIMDGKFTTDVLSVSYGNTISFVLGNIARKYVFCSDQILKTEIAAGNILDFLLSKFIPAAIRREDKAARTPMDERLFGIISDNYRKNYDHYSKDEDEETRLYLRLLLVTDYVCGMTDSFAKRLYQELGGIQ